MSAESNKQLVRDYYERIVATGDVSRIAHFIAADYVEIYQGVRHQLGLDGARAHVLGVRAAFPDLLISTDRQLAEADWVVTCITARGTHLGAWLGMAPTGRALEFTAVNLDRIVDGRIAEHTGAANLLEPLLTAGALQITDPAR